MRFMFLRRKGFVQSFVEEGRTVLRVGSYVSHCQPKEMSQCQYSGHILRSGAATMGAGYAHMALSKKSITPPIRKKPPPEQKATPISVAHLVSYIITTSGYEVQVQCL